MSNTIQALVLAAGQSRRYGDDKRHACLPCGTPLWQAVLNNLSMSVKNITLAVKPGESGYFQSHARVPLLRVVEVPEPERGMGSTISSSLEYIDSDKLLIVLADMPFVQASSFNQVCAALTSNDIVVPTFQSRRGHPVGFHRRYFSELSRLDGDSGGKVLLQKHANKVLELAVDDPGILYDIDTRQDLSAVTDDDYDLNLIV